MFSISLYIYSDLTALIECLNAATKIFPTVNYIVNCADSMSVWNLLREFRVRKVHMAVVLNEYGGTIGVCSLILSSLN